jgi:ATP-dependent Lhr-like helicase
MAADPAREALLGWFRSKGWSPFPFQLEAWAGYEAGESGLVAVPTGAGKTYAAYLGPLAELIRTPARGLTVLYLTPLRAVARDIELALAAPVQALGIPDRVESRTGDTSASRRARQHQRLPEVLLTTPESLSLLLSLEQSAALFAGVRAVIVDEWHELLGTKRGTQVELALARLRALAPSLRTWALSATLPNLDEALAAALGVGGRGRIVRADLERPVIVETLIPEVVEAMPWAGHMGLTMVPALLQRVRDQGSTLVFTNTRSQAELWYQAIVRAGTLPPEAVALHHGSLDRAERERVEGGLKSGAIRLVVATSSLDLGVDFSPVEGVAQVGSPKGVARLIQRAGRASHRPGAPCRILCVPTYALELLEFAAAREAIDRHELEPRRPLEKPIDVLVQHLVTVALGGGFEPDPLLAEVRTAWAYRDLSAAEFDWALRMVRDGGSALGAYDRYHRVSLVEGRYRVPSRRIAQWHRMMIGTITTDAAIELRFQNGTRIGSIDEGFIGRLKPGDRFVFAGRVLSFLRVRDLVAYVRLGKGKTANTPRWSGARMPFSTSLGRSIRRALDRIAVGGIGVDDPPEIRAVAPVLALQRERAALPREDQLLVELCRTRDGWHCFLYPCDGRQVHEGLASLLAWRLGSRRPATFGLTANDYGIELLSAEPFPYRDLLGPELFRREGLIDEVLASVNAGELARRRFRDVARVAGLVFPGYPGSGKSIRQLQASSNLIYDVFSRYDPDNLLLAQATREVLEQHFEASRFAEALDRLGRSEILIREVRRPTPFALPLLLDRFGSRLTTEELLDRVDRLTREWRLAGAVEP